MNIFKFFKPEKKKTGKTFEDIQKENFKKSRDAEDLPVYESLEELLEYLKLKLAPKAPKVKCDHTWARVGFSGPYWAYECVKCGEEDYGR